MAKEVICGIYKVVNPEGKIYIGQAINCLNRWHSGRYHSQELIYNSIIKYGRKEHKFEILETCEKGELDDKETYWIAFYDTWDTEHGLNLQSGGKNFKVSKSTRKKQSEKRIGKPLSQETKRKLSENSPKPMLGKHHTAESKQKNRESQIKSGHAKGNQYRKGLKLSEEHITRLKELTWTVDQKKEIGERSKEMWNNKEFKEKMCAMRKGIPKSKEHAMKVGIAQMKQVFNTQTGIFYESIKDACQTTHYSISYFRNMLNGRQPNKTSFIKS